MANPLNLCRTACMCVSLVMLIPAPNASDSGWILVFARAPHISLPARLAHFRLQTTIFVGGALVPPSCDVAFFDRNISIGTILMPSGVQMINVVPCSHMSYNTFSPTRVMITTPRPLLAVRTLMIALNVIPPFVPTVSITRIRKMSHVLVPFPSLNLHYFPRMLSVRMQYDHFDILSHSGCGPLLILKNVRPVT